MKAFIILVALSLTGCAGLGAVAGIAGLGEEYDFAQQKTRLGIGKGIKTYCATEGFSLATRKAALAEINAAAAPARISAFDCNGDGQPDF